MPKPTKTIELRPLRRFEDLTIPEKVATWIVNIGRVLIIGTELLAFSVFVARIKLDRDLTDLSEQLENQLVILQNATDLEQKINDYHTRIALIKELKENQKSASAAIHFFTRQLPPRIVLTGFTFRPSGVFLLSAKTDSALAFAKLIEELRVDDRVLEIGMTAGRFDLDEGWYYFSLKIVFIEDGRSDQ